MFREEEFLMKYLFLVSIGPVQAFIASARRTRDLWFGSWLLSELSKAAAQEIVHNRIGNSLIFPAPSNEQLLEKDTPLNIANKIVALIDEPPQQLGKAVYEAIKKRLDFIKDQVFKKVVDFDQATAEKQIENLVEYLWVALPFENTDYAKARKNLEALMVARKNTRDFKHVSWGSSAPKSSLDGQLESVIPERLYQRRGLSAQQQQKQIKELYDNYKAGPAEQLSGVDLLKRLGNAGNEAHFPSTSHIAALPYLMRLTKLDDSAGAKELLDAYVAKIYEIAGLQKRVVMIDRIPEQYADWEHEILGGYDGSLLFEERLVDIVTDTTGFEPAKEILRAFYAHVKARPIPYYAILLADGDFIGVAIDAQSKHAKEADKHREISRVLAGFSRDARKIVKNHLGTPVYAGGDDVLAFMPLHTVFACAKELAEEFSKRLTTFTYDKDHSPTLSIGIAVVHHLDSLREALDLARNAEKQAKGVSGKNAVAIRVSKRSGEERAVAGKWGKLDERMTHLITLYRKGDIPEGTSYELRELAQRLTGPTGVDGLQEAMLADAKRILQRKLSMRQKTRTQHSAAEAEEILNTLLAMLGGEDQREPGQPETAQNSRLRVEEFATELIVARFFADAMELAEPQKKEHYEEDQE
jgi:CRISPR-associated protein Cmr2